MRVHSSPIRDFGSCEGLSEALALSVELRSSLGILPEDAGWEAPVVPPVVPVVPLEKFLLELLGAMQGGAPVSVELGSAVPALIQHSPEPTPSVGDGMLRASAGVLRKAAPCCAQPCHCRGMLYTKCQSCTAGSLSRIWSLGAYCVRSKRCPRNYDLYVPHSGQRWLY